MNSFFRFLIISTALLAAGSATQDNFPMIRKSGDLEIRRFDDGSNTCYTASHGVYVGRDISISCVVRSK